MLSMIQYKVCPVCNSSNIESYLKVKDFTVSHNFFEIVRCTNCTVLITQSVPAESEIGKYYQSESYISHTDTQKGFINSLYHKVRKRTLSQKKKLIERYTKTQTGKILDIGCGTGAFLNVMKHSGWQVTGLEPDPSAAKIAIDKYNIQPLPSDNLFLLPDANYDAITMWHVLEHVHQLGNYLQQIEKSLKPNGTFFIAVPNYTSFDARYYKEYWAAYDVPRHLYHFSPKSMGVLLSNYGLVLDEVKPMWFDSFYVSMLSESYKNGKGNNFKAFFVGLISNLKTVFNKKKCSSLIYIIRKTKTHE